MALRPVTAGPALVASTFHFSQGAEVTLWEPPARLEYHWPDDLWPGRTKVSFHLVKARTGTRLVLEKSGWEALPVRTRPELIQAHAEQWSYYMGRLVALAR